MTIFKYLDYRLYLKTAIKERKKSNPRFSLRVLAQKAGFSSPGYFQMIVDGKRNVSPKSLDKINHVLKHSKDEAAYFSALVQFNQSKSDQSADIWFEELVRLRPKTKEFKLSKDILTYYSNRNVVIIRELVALPDFKEDMDWISKRLKSRITPSDAKRIIDMLLRLNLLRRNDKGRLVHGTGHPTTDPAIESMEVFKYHADMLKEAYKALVEVPNQLKDLTSLTIPMTKESMKDIKKEILKFRQQIVEKINHGSKNFDEVFQINIQLFPITQKDNEEADAQTA